TQLLSADDLLAPGALARATELLEAHPEVAFVYCPTIRLLPEKNHPDPESGTGRNGWQIWPGASWVQGVFSKSVPFLDSPEVVARTRMYKTLGGYRPELPHTADVDVWLRFAAHGSVGRVDADQAYYRVHGNNMHN